MSSPKKEGQCVDTGTIFESLISAAKWAGIKSSRITAGAMLRGQKLVPLYGGTGGSHTSVQGV